jgi:hypothetical protein
MGSYMPFDNLTNVIYKIFFLVPSLEVASDSLWVWVIWVLLGGGAGGFGGAAEERRIPLGAGKISSCVGCPTSDTQLGPNQPDFLVP